MRKHLRLAERGRVLPSEELRARPVERVWGKPGLPPEWPRSGGTEPIGEIWFETMRPDDAELLVKYLFTADRLSIQVHPDDEGARAAGRARGKDEAWLVLDADPGAVIGLGLREAVPKEALRAAALDGGIEALIDWRPVSAGDFFYSPAGTVHAIGAGLTLIEIQQNLDLTYRLYDYGRPRELHLEEAVAAADAAPWRRSFAPIAISPGREILYSGGAFVVERWTMTGSNQLDSADGQLLLIPLREAGRLDGQALAPGAVWRVAGNAALDSETPLDLLAAYPGREVHEALLKPCLA